MPSVRSDGAPRQSKMEARLPSRNCPSKRTRSSSLDRRFRSGNAGVSPGGHPIVTGLKCKRFSVGREPRARPSGSWPLRQIPADTLTRLGLRRYCFPGQPSDESSDTAERSGSRATSVARPATLAYRFAAVYGLFFLLAVVASPHRHLNAFEDLVSDGPSDSGTIVLQPAAGEDPCVSARVEMDDDPLPWPAFRTIMPPQTPTSSSFSGSPDRFASFFPADPPVPQSISDSPASRSPPRSARLS